jgi:hypothetical protein
VSEQYENELIKILERLVSQFAEKDEEGNWWGFDTNVGARRADFATAIRSIRAFKLRHMRATPKEYTQYKELGYLNRAAIAKAVWGSKIPGWWKGSRAEFGLLSAVKRAKS